MTRQELRAIYEQGLEGMIAFVESLLALIAQQQQTITELQAEVKALKERLACDSHNSHKPPSCDSFKPKPKSLRQKSDKKPGGQKGHQGTTLLMVEHPDKIIDHPAKRCQFCGHSLEQVSAKKYERRQVFDLPPLKLEVTEHRAEVKECPHCHQENKGEFPEGVTNTVQYGEKGKALGVYLTSYQLLPYERTSELLEDLFGCSLSEGSLQALVEESYEGLEETEEKIKEGIKRSDVASFDETGMKVEGEICWVHVSSTESLTHYGCQGKRGKEGMDGVGILPEFEGTAVHDGLSSYQEYECRHGLCNAHHLRDLTFVEEEYKQGWAKAMKDLLLEIKETVEEEKGEGKLGLEEWAVKVYEEKYHLSFVSNKMYR